MTGSGDTLAEAEFTQLGDGCPAGLTPTVVVVVAVRSSEPVRAVDARRDSDADAGLVALPLAVAVRAADGSFDDETDKVMATDGERSSVGVSVGTETEVVATLEWTGE